MQRWSRGGPWAAMIAGLLLAGCAHHSTSSAPADAGLDNTPTPCGAIDEACCLVSPCDSPLACRDSSCQPAPASGVGQPCTADTDCTSGLCLTAGAAGKVCTTSCSTSSDCVPGWQCSSVPGLSGGVDAGAEDAGSADAGDEDAGSANTGLVCTCTPSSEVCDGLDNDCDGIVDDEPDTDDECAQKKAGEICRDGSCQCGAVCGGDCVDPATDPDNCGGCGQRCTADGPATATCALSHCVVTLASGQSAPGGVAVDATNVYWTNWTDEGTLVKAPLAGGAPVTLATGQYQPTSVIVDGSYIYWTNLDGIGAAGATVMREPLTGGTPVTLASMQTQPDGLAIDATNLYWVESGGDIVKLPLSGGPAVTLTSNQGTLWGIAIDTHNVYWTNPGGGNVASVPIDGGDVVTLANGLDQPIGIAADGTNVYWTDSSLGTITMLPVAAGSMPVTLATGQAAPWGIAVDAQNVYWTTFEESGTVMSVPIAGGPTEPTTLAEGQWGPLTIIVDASSVYWTDNGGSTVMQLSPK